MAEGTDPSTAPTETRTFTQDEVNSFLAREQKKLEAKTAAAIAAAKAEAAKEYEAKFAEQSARLEELELKGKSAEERERIAADKAARALKEREALLTSELAAKEAAIKELQSLRERDRNTHLVTTLYGEAKGLPKMLRHALPAILADVTLEWDEDGKPVAARIDGLTKTPAEAIAHWLAKPENDGFVAHPGGGSGAHRPNGGPGNGRRLPDDADPAAMLAAGLAEPIRQ